MKSILIIICGLTFTLCFSQAHKSICGDVDDRVPSDISPIGRAAKKGELVGCTVTLIGDYCVLTAGHCAQNVEKFSFNVPLAHDGIPQESNPENIYFIDSSFLKYKINGEGDDWAVLKVLPNTISGLSPGKKHGYFPVRLDQSTQLNDDIMITGYGIDANDPVSNFSQQTHYGKVRRIGGWLNSASRIAYDIDTMRGNSGSAIILEKTQEIIGIHSHGYCEVWGPYNEGTLIANNNEFKKAITKCLE